MGYVGRVSAAPGGPLPAGALHSSWVDPRRRLPYADYLSVQLFGLPRPVLKTLQARRRPHLPDWLKPNKEVGNLHTSGPEWKGSPRTLATAARLFHPL